MARAFERPLSRKWHRVFLPAVLAAGAALTCDEPTGPLRHNVALGFQPVLSTSAIAGFGGLSVDQARVIVVAPPTDTVASKTYEFSPDSTELKAAITVTVTDSATFAVTIQLLSGSTLLFCGVDTELVRASIPTTGATPVTLQYCGPGTNVDSIRIAPRDSGVAAGGQVQFRIAAWDSTGTSVTQFYTAWATRGTANTINADGVFRAGTTNGPAWIVAHTPTGVWDSTQITVGAQVGVPASLAKAAGDLQSAPVGTAVAIAPRVKVADALGNPVPGAAVTFAVAGGGGSITGASTTTDASGLASVGSWTLGAAAGTNTLTATVTGLTPVTFTATGTAVTGVITLSVPGNLVGIGASQQAQAVVTLSPAAPAGGLTVTVTSDSSQYVTVQSPGTVTIAAGQVTGTLGLSGVAAGTTILHATAPGYTAGTTAAVATPNFLNLTYDSVAVGRTNSFAGFKLSTAAPAGGLIVGIVSVDSTKLRFIKGAVTNPPVGIIVDTVPAGTGTSYIDFTITGLAAGTVPVYAAASNYAIGLIVTIVYGSGGTLALVSGGGQTGGVDSLLPQPITVQVDSAGVGISGYLVDFAVATGGGTVSTTGVLTNAAGQASTSWTLGPTAGTQSLSVTAPGATPLTVTATTTGAAIASTTVTPSLDTITAINGTATLVAQAKTASGGNVTGSYTWTSRNTAIASVSTLGVVTGLANGATYVVATEAGGTKDSAQIVVQQKLASITVTPANRNLYLGTSLAYTAQAVDGLGTPLPSNPAFTWTTSAPAVATVDTANHGTVDTVGAVGLGTAQIKATSGTITGIGNLSVLTAITRIAVAVDSSGATKNDTASLPSLGVARRYHAYAYDTLNALMPAVTQFTWASSNPSVANVPNETSDTATATAAANGVTTIRAAAQGFTSSPGASLTVAQVLASIQLTPASATIAVNGSVPLTARGLDANSHYISGGAFGFVASNGTATVGATSGVVTGVSLGADTITADSGAIVSNRSIVVVSSTVPPAISFGRDTVSVGRGSQASIPILVSTPPVGVPLLVKLAVNPNAYAHWSTPTVTILSGGTSVNATLVGDSAGTTTVIASDSSGLGYAPDTVVAKVTANMSLASGSYYVNATDLATTQVLLSDPSPAGGTYVTYSYGTPGIAAVSPDPAYIPPGQLAADIQIRALGAGSTTITPVAAGVNGVSSTFTAYSPALTLYNTREVLGLGQYDPNGYVYLPTNTNLPLLVTLTSSDTTKVTATPAVTIGAGSNYAYFTVSATGLGTANVAPSAAGWTANDHDSVIVSTPHVGVCCGGTIYTTSGIQNLSVYSEDSTKAWHDRSNSLLVSLRSSDTTVMKVVDSTITIGPGSYYASPRVTPGALGGTAYVVASASGHTSDSVLYTVNGPPLAFSWSGTRLVGLGEQDINGVYVYVPNSVPAPLVVRLTTTDSTVVGVPDSVIIPTGNNYVYFTVQGLKLGTATFTATAAGFQTATGSGYTVTSPTIILNTTSYTFNNFNAGTNFYVYSADTTRGTHARIAPDTLTVVVRDTTVATVDSATEIIAAGQYYNSNRHITPTGVGSTYLVLTANGQQVLDSLHITVNTPLIQIDFGSTTLGRRQHLNSNGNGFYIYTPDSRPVTVPATMSQKHAAVDSLSTVTPTIPANTNYVYLDAFGLAAGTDTIAVSAAGYNSGSPAYITVTTPRLTGGSLPSSTTTTNLSPINSNVYTGDSLGSSHYTMDTVTVHAVSSDTSVIKPDSAYYHVLPNGYYVQTSVHVYGPGSAYMVYSDSAGNYTPDTTNTVTVTGPSLFLSTGSTVLGMRQTTGSNAIYVYTQNDPATPVTVYLTSSDTAVATVPDSVIIPTTTNYVYFPITAMDTLGTIQVKAQATGFAQTVMSVQVTRPKFAINTCSQANTTSGRCTITVYAEDQNGTTHYTTDSVIVHLASSATGVATVDSAVVTIPIGQYSNNHATWGPASLTTPGTAQLSASDTTAALYAYQTATYPVTVLTPTVSFDWGTQTLGVGQYNNVYVYTPDNASVAPFNVVLTHTGLARTIATLNGVTVDTIPIPVGTNYTYFHVVGSAVGMDTLVGSIGTPPFNPGTAYSAVSLGRVDPLGNWPGTLSQSANDSVQIVIYARDSTQGTHYVQDSTTFTLNASGAIQFWSGGANSAPITSVVMPQDAYLVYIWVKGVAQGTGQATISATGYTTYTTPTVTVGP